MAEIKNYLINVMTTALRAILYIHKKFYKGLFYPYFVYSGKIMDIRKIT